MTIVKTPEIVCISHISLPSRVGRSCYPQCPKIGSKKRQMNTIGLLLIPRRGDLEVMIDLQAQISVNRVIS
jgi:hypothetical protein